MNCILSNAPLRNAGIEKCNLVQVSSIFPPGCKMIPKSQGLKYLVPGALRIVL
jgi:arginine decarboxylase